MHPLTWGSGGGAGFTGGDTVRFREGRGEAGAGKLTAEFLQIDGAIANGEHSSNSENVHSGGAGGTGRPQNASKQWQHSGEQSNGGASGRKNHDSGRGPVWGGSGGGGRIAVYVTAAGETFPSDIDIMTHGGVSHKDSRPASSGTVVISDAARSSQGGGVTVSKTATDAPRLLLPVGKVRQDCHFETRWAGGIEAHKLVVDPGASVVAGEGPGRGDSTMLKFKVGGTLTDQVEFLSGLRDITAYS